MVRHRRRPCRSRWRWWRRCSTSWSVGPGSSVRSRRQRPCSSRSACWPGRAGGWDHTPAGAWCRCSRCSASSSSSRRSTWWSCSAWATRPKTTGDKEVLALSMVASGVAALIFVPVRARFLDSATRFVYGSREAPDEVLRTFGSRLTRAIPMDELLLQLAESLRKTMALPAPRSTPGRARCSSARRRCRIWAPGRSSSRRGSARS